MKTFKNLYPQVYAFNNLLLAARKARLGKRKQYNVARFNFFLEQNLLQLQKELNEKTYTPGRYDTFTIFEPKKRMISAAPYRDRVVHHALCNVIEPLIERTFIADSYANRKGKGTHRALDRYKTFAKRNRYVLKCDIKDYFPSIDHELLKGFIQRKIACENTLWLIDRIIANSNPQKAVYHVFPGDDLFTNDERRKGLPIGNLTSQFFANVYLNPLDHFIKEQLQCKYYIRYVDDFVVFGGDKRKLYEILHEIKSYLQQLRLKVHDNKSRVFPVNTGIPFLGHVMFPDYSLLKGDNVKRQKKRIGRRMELLKNGKMRLEQFSQGMKSWGAHARYSRTYHLRNHINNQLLSEGIDLTKGVLRGGSWNNNDNNCRVANRNRNNPDNTNNNNGFRIAR